MHYLARFCRVLILLTFLARPVYAVTPAVFGISSLIPGLGQMLNGNFLEGATWLVATVGLYSTNDRVLRNIGFDVHMYNMYDAWKDAGGTPSQKKIWVQEYAENFNPVHLIDPFAIGLVGGAAIVTASGNDNHSFSEGLPRNTASRMLLFSFVGFGEESLFRGFLYPSLSSWLTPFGGAVVSSAMFSLAHIGAGSQANAFRFVLGMIFCWQYSTNNYDLGGNIFAHSWYDQMLVSSLDVDPFDDRLSNEKFEYKDMPLGLKISYKF
jgi:hypothetical protein